MPTFEEIAAEIRRRFYVHYLEYEYNSLYSKVGSYTFFKTDEGSGIGYEFCDSDGNLRHNELKENAGFGLYPLISEHIDILSGEKITIKFYGDEFDEYRKLANLK